MSTAFWLSPAQRRQRAISTCVALVIITLVTAIILVFWWQPLSRERARLKTQLDRRDQFEAALSMQAELDAVMQKARASMDQARALWPESSRIEAQSAMSKQLNLLIDQIGGQGRRCKLENVSPVSQGPSLGGVRPVGITARMLCGNAEWLQLVRALDASSPAMILDNITIQSPQSGEVNARHPMATNALQIQMDVYGYTGIEPMIAGPQ